MWSHPSCARSSRCAHLWASSSSHLTLCSLRARYLLLFSPGCCRPLVLSCLTMADFRFGDCLRSGPGASQAASPSAESFSTASGGDGTGVTGKSYPVSLINVDEKCLRLIGRGKTSICMKESCGKHKGDRLEISGSHWCVINATGNLTAIYEEVKGDSLELGIDIASSFEAFWRPSLAQILWGFADAALSVYCYWILGKLFAPDEKPSAVAFFKCVQSLGYTLGFYLIPTATRLSAMHQLLLSSAIFVGGTLLAIFQLPPSL